MAGRLLPAFQPAGQKGYRMEIGRSYKESFSFLPAVSTGGAAAAEAPRAEVTADLEAAWESDGGGLGGRTLDERLTNLGRAYVANGRVRWEPPTDLDQALVAYLSRSVADLNSRLRSGELTV